MEKFTNYLLSSGKKRLSQNNFLIIAKNLQKWSDKNYKILLKLSFVFLIQFFKINTVLIKSKQNNRPFLVVHKNKNWIFLATKLLIQRIKNNKSISLFKNLYAEIILVLNKNSNTIKTKKMLQNQIVLKKHVFFYFRWR